MKETTYTRAKPNTLQFAVEHYYYNNQYESALQLIEQFTKHPCKGVDKFELWETGVRCCLKLNDMENAFEYAKLTEVK